MADQKISLLNAVVTPVPTDELAVVNAGETKRISIAQLQSVGGLLGDIVTATPPTTENVTGAYQIYDADNTDLLANMGFEAGNALRIKNLMRGGEVRLLNTDAAGTLQVIVKGTAAGATSLHWQNAEKLETISGGIALRGGLTGTPSAGGNYTTELIWREGSGSQVGRVGWSSNDILSLQNQVHGGNVNITAENVAGTVLTMASFDPDTEDTTFGGGIIIPDTGGTDTARFYNDGLNFRIDFANVPNFDLNGLTSSFRVNSNMYVQAGNSFRIYDSTNSDLVQFLHNGTDLVTTFVGTTDWDIEDIATLRLRDAANLQLHGGKFFMRSDNDSNFASFDIGGNTSLQIGSQGVTSVQFIGYDQMWLRDGQTLRIGDALDTDWLEMSHNGSAFNHVYTNTLNVFNLGGRTYTFNTQENAATAMVIGEGTTLRGGSQSARMEMYGETVGVIYSGEFGVRARRMYFEGGASGIQADVEGLDVNMPEMSINIGSANPTVLNIGEQTVIRGSHTGGTINMYAEAASTISRFSLFMSSNTGVIETDTGDIAMRPNGGQVTLQAGAGLRVQDTTDTYLQTRSVVGDNLWETSTGLVDHVYRLYSGTLDLQDGMGLRIRDALDTDWADFSHDGTDFLTDFTNTGRWRVNRAMTIGASSETLAETLTVAAGFNQPIAAFENIAGNGGYLRISNINAAPIHSIGIQFEKGNPTASEGFIGYREDADEIVVAGSWTQQPLIGVNPSAHLRVYRFNDTTKYMQLSHDGTDFNTRLAGTADWNISGITGTYRFDKNVVVLTDIDTLTPPTNEAVTGGYNIRDAAGDDELARFGFAGSDRFEIINRMHGGDIWIVQEDSAGLERPLLTGSGDSQTVLYYAGDARLVTKTSGVEVTRSGNLSSTFQLGENATLEGDSADAIFDMYGEQTGIIYGQRFAVQSQAATFGGVGANPITSLNFGVDLDMTGGNKLRIRDTLNTDWADFSHDGVNFNTVFTNTAGWFVTGIGANDFDVDTNRFIVRSSVGTSSPPVASDSPLVTVEFWDTESTPQLAAMGFGGNADFQIQNRIHGGRIILQQENAAGTLQNLFIGDPDGATSIYHEGTSCISTNDGGITTRDNISSLNPAGGGAQDTKTTFQNASGFQNAVMGFQNSANFKYENEVWEGGFLWEVKDDAGAAKQALSIQVEGAAVLIAEKADVGLTAHIGSAQGNGVILASHNVYSTVANTGDAATLPAVFEVGTKVFVKNDGANSMDIFPALGDNAGAGTNTAVALASGVGTLFVATVANATWTQMF
jgi:hypothetical protein